MFEDLFFAMADRPGDRQHGEPARDDVPPHVGIFTEPAITAQRCAGNGAASRPSDVGFACSCACPLCARVSTRGRLRLRARVCVHACCRVAFCCSHARMDYCGAMPNLRRSLSGGDMKHMACHIEHGCCAACNISARHAPCSVCNAQHAALCAQIPQLVEDFSIVARTLG